MVMLRMPGCPDCRRSTSGNCGAHEPVYTENALLASRDALAWRVVALEAALRALVGVDPREASEVDGSLSCHYCGEWYSGLEPRHDADCPWVAARALLSGDGGEG